MSATSRWRVELANPGAQLPQSARQGFVNVVEESVVDLVSFLFDEPSTVLMLDDSRRAKRLSPQKDSSTCFR